MPAPWTQFPIPTLNLSDAFISKINVGSLKVTPDVDVYGAFVETVAYPDYTSANNPDGSNTNFNTFRLWDYAPNNVTEQVRFQTILIGDGPSVNWGSSNSLTEKIVSTYEMVLFAAPTGSPGPHQPVGLGSTARTPPGVGACPTVELFAANFITIAAQPTLGMIGNEYDMVVDVGSGGSVGFKIGQNVGTAGADGTDGNDVAYITGSDLVASWTYGYSWFNLSIKGSIMGASPGTVLNVINGIDFTGVTFSQFILKSAGMGILADGTIRPGAINAAGLGTPSLYWNSTFSKAMFVQGDNSGQAGFTGLTGISDVTANSTGVGSIKFKSATSRDSSGFIKIYIGTTPYYVPVFSAIT